MVNHENHRICAATATLPLSVLLLAVEITPHEQVDPTSIVMGLRCSLEEHSTGPHYDMVRELKNASGGELWTHWADGFDSECVVLLPDCNTSNGKRGAGDESCMLFELHPGGHTFEFADPEYEAVERLPEFRRLKAELDSKIRPARTPHP